VRRSSSWNRRGPATLTLVVITVFFAAMAWFSDASGATLRDRGITTQATVVSYRGGSSTWTEVRFNLPSGRSVQAVLEISLASYVVGETIPVRYDPANPDLVGDERALDDRTLALIAAGFAVVCAVGAVLTWLRVLDWQAIARRWH
jgi:Protein of unknown function (DUF3592)